MPNTELMLKLTLQLPQQKNIGRTFTAEHDILVTRFLNREATKRTKAPPLLIYRPI